MFRFFFIDYSSSAGPLKHVATAISNYKIFSLEIDMNVNILVMLHVTRGKGLNTLLVGISRSRGDYQI